MKKVIILAVVVATMLGASWTQAATYAGMRELQVQGTLERDTNNRTDDEDYTVTWLLGYNYFMAPQLSLGFTSISSVSMTKPDDSNDDETYFGLFFLLGRGTLYLTGGAGKVVPYIGGQAGGVVIGYKQGDDDDTSFEIVYGGFGGVKVFATENTSWNVEGGLLFYEYDLGDDDTLKGQTASLTFGFSYYF